MANQLEQVLKKTKAVYKQAAEELKKKLADFQARFAAADKEKRALLAAGEITEKEYKSWLAGQVFQGKQWEAKAKEAATTMVHANEEAAAIVNDGCMTAYAAAMNYGTYELEKATGINTGFTLYNRETVSRLLGKDPQLLPKWKIDQPKDYVWNYEKVKNAVLQGIIQGKPIPQIANDLTDKLQTLNTNKMRLFARTGMTGAQNAGRIDALHRAEDAGIKVKKKWLTMIDGRQRDAHEDLNGQIRDIDEPFDSELGPIDYPGDPSADPANVYNCRCTLVYIYPELEEAPEGTEPAPEYENMDYDQWVEAKENQEAVQGETDPETVTMEDAREIEPEIVEAAEELEETEPEPILEEEPAEPEIAPIMNGDRTVCEHGVEYGELFTDEQREITERTIRELDTEDPLGRPLGEVVDVRVSRGIDHGVDHLELYEDNPNLVPCNAQYLSPGHNAPVDSEPKIEIHNEGLSTQTLSSEFDDRHALREKYGDGSMEGSTAFDYAASSLEGTIRHEYAHALMDSYGFFGNGEEPLQKEAREWVLDFWKNHQHELMQISKYAASHPDEMIAECYVQIADKEHQGTIAYQTANTVITKMRGYIERAKGR